MISILEKHDAEIIDTWLDILIIISVSAASVAGLAGGPTLKTQVPLPPKMPDIWTISATPLAAYPMHCGLKIGYIASEETPPFLLQPLQPSYPKS